MFIRLTGWKYEFLAKRNIGCATRTDYLAIQLLDWNQTATAPDKLWYVAAICWWIVLGDPEIRDDARFQ